jgi:hypothetical protein
VLILIVYCSGWENCCPCCIIGVSAVNMAVGMDDLCWHGSYKEHQPTVCNHKMQMLLLTIRPAAVLLCVQEGVCV